MLAAYYLGDVSKDRKDQHVFMDSKRRWPLPLPSKSMWFVVGWACVKNLILTSEIGISWLLLKPGLLGRHRRDVGS